MKKVFAAGALSILMTAALVMPASAHGHHGGSHHGWTQDVPAQSTAVSVCPFDGCTAVGQHIHDGITYCGYAHGGGTCGGTCLELCSVEGCDISGRHSHDGVTYCGYAHSSGFCDGTCPELCPVEGCDISGRHSHDGVTYCGYVRSSTKCSHAGAGCHGRFAR